MSNVNGGRLSLRWHPNLFLRSIAFICLLSFFIQLSTAASIPTPKDYPLLEPSDFQDSQRLKYRTIIPTTQKRAIAGAKPKSAIVVKDPNTISSIMKKAISSASAKFGGTIRAKIQNMERSEHSVTARDTASTITTPTAQDVFRYRYHHGANLGSIFVLERWLTSSMFPSTAASSQTSELEAAKLWIAQEGVTAARARFEAFWANTITDADLDYLANTAHATSLRLPIGFFTLGPTYCKGTAFADVAAIYTNAWAAVKTLISRANYYGIGILIDLHALPGGANSGEHSGTNSGKTQLWGNSTNLNLAIECIKFITQEAKSMNGVLGVQVVNEAAYGASGMYDWYNKILTAVGSIDSTVPIYISDGWDFATAIAYLNKKNAYNTTTNPVIIDTHLYWIFTDADKEKSPQQIVAGVSSSLSELDNHDGNVIDRGAAAAIVGEYSDVMSEESWAKIGSDSKDNVTIQFGKAQSARYQARAGGSFFWTYKMDWMPGGAWGFKSETNSGAISAPPWLTISKSDIQNRISTAEAGREARMVQSVNEHVNYWNSTVPGKGFEHWRFENGWKVGFNDSSTFLGMRASGKMGNSAVGGDKIGLLDLWVRKRIRESGQAGEFLWEFEQGLRRGVRDFNDLAGV